MNKQKKELAQLVRSKYYKTVNVLIRNNPNTWTFNTKELNEEIPCEKRQFLKRKGVMKFPTRSRHNT